MKDAVNKAERVGLGMLVDARDTQERWCEAKIVDLNAKKREVFVHYVGWNARYDAWLSVKFLTAHGSHTGDSKKNASSWDGKTSLFTMENAVKKESSGHNAEPQKGVMSLKSPSSSIVKKKVAAKAEPEVRNASPVSSRKRRSRSDQSNHKEVDETKDSEHESDLTPSEKRPKRSAAARADSKISVKPELPVKAEPQDKQKQKKSKKASVKVHPVRVVVATTDEASERKSRRNRKENVDMEFDMDVRGGHESTSASEDEDAEPGAESASDDDSLTRLKKSKKKKLKKTSAANNKTKVSGSRRTTAATQVSTKVKEAEVEETKSDADTLPPVASPSQGKRHAKKAAASESPPTTTTAVSVKKQQQQSGK
ncbi:Multidrug/oligosaccharidyl-lipid/polysaccharide, partial [Globisporangium polare]